MFALHSFLTAIQFLTRVPVPGGMTGPRANDLSLLKASVVWFPLVGGLISLAGAGIIHFAATLWPLPVAVLLGLVAEALLTGGFHEDAVADTCDAFGGGWTRDDVLRILKDSRIGSFGALGLLLAVSLRGFGLASLEPDRLVTVAVASGGLGRWAILYAMLRVPPVPAREGLSKDVGESLTWGRFALGGALAVVPVLAWGLREPERLLVSFAAVVVLAEFLGWRFRRRIGGITGDCLGCVCYLSMIAVLLAATARF